MTGDSEEDGPVPPATPRAASTPTDPEAPTAGLRGPIERAVPAAFLPGDELAGRFRIVRFVGQGGMGQVYEADDRVLGERVALKTVHPDVAHDPAAIERFRREISVARKVTHPNVCRLFDLFEHEGADGRRTAFVTMELLPGETLAAFLRRRGRMGTEEAWPVVRQVVAGLAAAHDAGVVHRDFKPGNVLLVEGSSDVRAVVTDFGLAVALGDRSAGPGPAQGTIAYMAPEQMERREPTPAIDVYALGLVIYEMVVGRPAWGHDVSWASAGRRLHEAPPPPSTFAPDLDPSWQRVVERCLQREPAARPASVRAVAEALAPRAPERRRPRWGRAGGALALALVAGGVAVVTLRRPPPAPVAPAPPGSVRARPAVAVLGFRNLAGRPEAAWLSNALVEMLGGELAAGEKLRTVPGEEVMRARRDLDLPEAESLARDTLARVRDHVGADLVVLGSYLAQGGPGGGRLRLDVRVQDARLGETVAHVTETGTEAELIDVVARVGDALRARLGVAGLSTAEKQAAKASQPASTGAARLYTEGLARLRLFDALAARDLLERAVAEDPRHALAWRALADAWARLGYDDKALAAARKSHDLAATLSREDRLAIEGRVHQLARAHDEAVDAYRVLAGFFPDDLDHALDLATAQVAAGRASEALSGVAALRRLPAPASDDPRLDLTEAEAAAALSDFTRQRTAAERALAKGEARQASHLVARALLEQGAAFWALGDTERATASFEKARRSFAEAGDRWGVARALNRLAGLPYERGDLKGARAMFEESLALAESIGDRKGIARQLGNLGDALLGLGDLGAARRMLERALAANRDAGNRDSAEDNVCNLGRLALLQGDLPTARVRFAEAHASAKSVGSRRWMATALAGLGRVETAAGNLALARAHHTEALALREETGQADTLAASRQDLAEVALEEGKAEEAVGLLRSALAGYAKKGFRDYEALAQALLARALAGRSPEAAAAGSRARELAQASQSPQVRLAVAVATAPFAAAADAAARLEAVEAEAGRLGLVPLQLEARLALAGLSGSEAARRAAGAEAARRGLGLLARKAR